jgi:hypothetical protein
VNTIVSCLKVYICIGVIIIGLCAGPIFGLIAAILIASDIIGKEDSNSNNETERDRI